jgi:hypothetical protein
MQEVSECSVVSSGRDPTVLLAYREPGRRRRLPSFSRWRYGRRSRRFELTVTPSSAPLEMPRLARSRPPPARPPPAFRSWCRTRSAAEAVHTPVSSPGQMPAPLAGRAPGRQSVQVITARRLCGRQLRRFELARAPGGGDGGRASAWSQPQRSGRGRRCGRQSSPAYWASIRAFGPWFPRPADPGRGGLRGCPDMRTGRDGGRGRSAKEGRSPDASSQARARAASRLSQLRCETRDHDGARRPGPC